MRVCLSNSCLESYNSESSKLELYRIKIFCEEYGHNLLD